MSVTGTKTNLGAKTLLSCSEAIARNTELGFCEGIYDLSSLKYEQSYLLYLLERSIFLSQSKII